MSSKFVSKSNRTPWMDVLTLITETKTSDADGYETIVETQNNVFCTFREGVNRTEFYDGLKNGLSLSAMVEMWQNEYSGQKKCIYNSVYYKIIRVYETGRGTIELTLSEEIR